MNQQRVPEGGARPGPTIPNPLAAGKRVTVKYHEGPGGGEPKMLSGIICGMLQGLLWIKDEAGDFMIQMSYIISIRPSPIEEVKRPPLIVP